MNKLNKLVDTVHNIGQNDSFTNKVPVSGIQLHQIAVIFFMTLMQNGANICCYSFPSQLVFELSIRPVDKR